jgi:hypothetical protein
MDENRSNKIVMAFLAGAALGAVVGYFLNSNKKDELVADLKEGASNLKQGIDDSLGKARDIVDSFKNSDPEPVEDTQTEA